MSRLGFRGTVQAGLLVMLVALAGCKHRGWTLTKQKQEPVAEKPLEKLIPEKPKPPTIPQAAPVRIYSSAELAAQREEVEPKSRYAPVPPSAHVHQLRPGETLFSVARKYYGDQRQWRRIYQANRNRIRDPQKLPAGMKLIIP